MHGIVQDTVLIHIIASRRTAYVCRPPLAKLARSLTRRDLGDRGGAWWACGVAGTRLKSPISTEARKSVVVLVFLDIMVPYVRDVVRSDRFFGVGVFPGPRDNVLADAIIEGGETEAERERERGEGERRGEGVCGSG